MRFEFSPNMLFLLTVNNKYLYLWNLHKKTKVKLNGLDGKIFSTGFSNDGRHMHFYNTEFSGIGLIDTGFLFGRKNSRVKAVFLGLTGAFSPDDSLFATAYNSKIFVYDLRKTNFDKKEGTKSITYESKECYIRFDSGDINIRTLKFSPNGKNLAVCAVADGTIILYDLESKKRKNLLLDHESTILHFDYSPSGTFIVACSEKGAATIWDAASGRIVKKISVEKKIIGQSFFLNEGKVLLSVCFDGAIHFWSTENWELLCTLYSLKNGFLWTTPPDEIAPSGWFFTERPDDIPVVRLDEQGNPTELLRIGDPERESYIQLYKRKDMILDRLFSPERYRSKIKRLGKEMIAKKIVKNGPMQLLQFK